MLSANIIRFIFLSATVVYIAGLFVDVINVDAAQYASISKEMLQSGSYLTVKHCGRDYLDKPPLLFWLSALMFKIFGFYNWAYKLPSLLFTFLGVYATYRLARSLYDINVARLAALILYTCQAFFMFNNDVRTDTILTACVITSIWLLYEYTETEKMKHFFGGSLFIALGLMAKGPLGIVVPSLALGIHFILKREWKHIFKPIWLLMLLLVLILLLPMCIGLYKQFGAEGIRFFFWTQSFGRITGENEWRNDAGYFYFVHTFLWSFIPWSVLAVYALGDSIRAYIKRRSLPEYISIGGFMLTFAALSLSKYKLPHYIFVVYPLAAIFTAAVFDSQIMYHKKTERILKLFHHVIFFVLLSLTFLSFYVFQI
jgi:4-amino-4-deoxy-L-arabinose transferase-like glycosyltransferase